VATRSPSSTLATSRELRPVGKAIRFCGRTESLSELSGSVVQGAINLSVVCSKDNSRHERRRSFVVRATGSDTFAAGPLLNLSDPAYWPFRSEGYEEEQWQFTLGTGNALCPTVVSNPIVDAPGPKDRLGDYQRWTLALGFHANPDCSVLIVSFVDEGVVFVKGKAHAVTLYELPLATDGTVDEDSYEPLGPSLGNTTF
jgi:hypothetical protein